jgi:CheY-like chemotaxis protein
MPIMDGMQATKQIKKLRPNLPIIAQTAYAFSEEKERILAGGCDDYISKPLKIDNIITLIKKYAPMELQQSIEISK